MLYYLIEYLRQHYDIPGLRLFQYITFRTSLAIIISLIITTVYGRRLINYLHKKQVGETVQEFRPGRTNAKTGYPNHGWTHYSSWVF